MNQLQQNIKEQIKNQVKQEIQTILETELKPKKPSGHVAAGKKWDTTEKGRAWKTQTLKAKDKLRRIIRERTGLNAFANQRMTFKYAAAIRDGRQSEANKIIEEVINNAIKKSKSSPVLNTSRKNRNNYNQKNKLPTEIKNTDSVKNTHRVISKPTSPFPPAPTPPKLIPDIQTESDFPDLTEPFSYEDNM
jgi:hypothetical protein